MAPDERRAAIVAAAVPLVISQGPGVSTRSIAQAADIAEGTIFRVFPDKEALMGAVMAEALDPAPTLRELAAIDVTSPLRDRLVAATEILQRRLTGVFGLLHAAGLPGPPHVDPHGQDCRPASPVAMNDALRTAIVDVVGPDHDQLRVPATEFARVLRLLLFSSSHPRISDGRPLPAEEIVAILLDGLLAPSPTTAVGAAAPTAGVTTMKDRPC